MDDTGNICGQCGKPAVASAGSSHLCVNCFHTLQVAFTLQIRMQAMGYNHAVAMMDDAAPFGPPTPRMQVPDIPRGPMILNHIKVEGGIVGSINTGNVHTIDVNISVLKTAGSEHLGEAIKQLTEVIANEHSVSASDKNDLLDQVAFLSEQAVAPIEKRRPGLVKSALETVGKTAETVTKIGAAWALVKPLLLAAFGF